MKYTRMDCARPLDDEEELVRYVLAAGYLPQGATTRRTAVRNAQQEVRLVFECASEAEFVGANARLQRLGLVDERASLADRPGGHDAAFRSPAQEEQVASPSPAIAHA